MVILSSYLLAIYLETEILAINGRFFESSRASYNRICDVVLVRVNLDHSRLDAPVEHETPELSGTIGNESKVDVAIGE